MEVDVLVVGAGPAGLAAARAAGDEGAKVGLVERESRAGGILKQCIHDGFGLLRFGEKLSGPEYAFREIKALKERGIELFSGTFVIALMRENNRFTLTLQNAAKGVFKASAAALVAATGCRERTSRQIFIHGERPAGIMNAGTAQNLINIHGLMPGSSFVILGSGDIGLIMARRLTLEGARVEGVFEIKNEPSGLTRNLVQCLDDFQIPLHLKSTVTAVHGARRVEGVTVAKVDSNMQPLGGSERFVSCDTLLLSVGLIPENEMLDSLKVPMDPKTGGPFVDQNMMTAVPGLFSCGNASYVYDLADYVTESGEAAGKAAAFYCHSPRVQGSLETKAGKNIASLLPQRLLPGEEAICYFRSERTMEDVRLRVKAGGAVLKTRKFLKVRPPEMERITLEPDMIRLGPIEFCLEEAVS